MSAFPWNTDRCTAVSNTVCEGIDAASLMSASKTHGVVLSINCDVLLVAAFQFLDSSLNVLHASLLAHFLAGEVAVKTGTIPIAWNWLGVERDFGAKFFSNTVEEETGQPEMVTH